MFIKGLAPRNGAEPVSFYGTGGMAAQVPDRLRAPDASIARKEKAMADAASVTAAPIGRTIWAIAEGYIPGRSDSSARELVSHEAACILNAGDAEAAVEITLYFTDREPAGPYRLTVPARRTRHFRFNDLQDPEPVPRDTPYASVIRSSVPVVVQHTRLDSRPEVHALLSTVAYAGGV